MKVILKINSARLSMCAVLVSWFPDRVRFPNLAANLHDKVLLAGKDCLSRSCHLAMLADLFRRPFGMHLDVLWTLSFPKSFAANDSVSRNTGRATWAGDITPFCNPMNSEFAEVCNVAFHNPVDACFAIFFDDQIARKDTVQN